MAQHILAVSGLYPAGVVDGRTIVRTSATTIYAIIATGAPSSSIVVYRKSTDNGSTWGPFTDIASSLGVAVGYGIWFDKWTPGDSGTKIHVWVADSTNDDITYWSLDTASDTLSSPVTVFNGASLTAPAQVSGCKTRGGNLLVAFNGDGGTETGFYRSTDGGTVWGSRATLIETATTDFFQLLPGNYADNQDADCIYWDTSANEISLKTYDDSANSVAEASISGSMTDQAAATVTPQFSASVRHSDGHAIVVAWNDRDTAAADLKVWDINGSGSITAKTDVNTNTDDCQAALLYINQSTNDLFAFYLGKSDGSQTIGTSLGVYYKVSADGATSWGSEQTLSSTLDRFTGIGGSISGTGAPLDVAWLGGTLTSAEFWAYFTPSRVGTGIGRGM